jgi:hypothetical protein
VQKAKEARRRKTAARATVKPGTGAEGVPTAADEWTIPTEPAELVAALGRHMTLSRAEKLLQRALELLRGQGRGHKPRRRSMAPVGR